MKEANAAMKEKFMKCFLYMIVFLPLIHLLFVLFLFKFVSPARTQINVCFIVFKLISDF